MNSLRPSAPRRQSSFGGASSMAQSFVTSPSFNSLGRGGFESSADDFVSAKSSLAPSRATDTEGDEADDDGSDTASQMSTSSRSRDDLRHYTDHTMSIPSPPSPSQSTSSRSSESAFQLDSPFPRPMPAHIRRSSAPGKENVEVNLVRMSHRGVVPLGFPYADSSAAAFIGSTYRSSSRPGPSKRKGERPPSAYDRLAVSDSHSRTGSKSSSDLDLDLSIDIHLPHRPTPSTSASADAVRYHLSAEPHVGIPISPVSRDFGSHHGVPERELVRSRSGKLLGTRKRVKSALELRAAYAAAEPAPATPQVAICIPADDGPRTIVDGFSFGATEPLSSSPSTSPQEDTSDSSKRVKRFPLPLKLVDRRGAVSGPSSPAQSSASPSWSVASFFIKVSATSPATSPRQTDDDQYANMPNSSATERSSWSGLTKSALSYLGSSAGGGGAARNAPSEASPSFSPLFDSYNSPGGQTTHTTATSIHEWDSEHEMDSPLEDDDGTARLDHLIEKEKMRQGKENEQTLAGLGFSFGGKPLPEVPLDELRSTARRQADLPSFSVSPPQGGHDEVDESDVDADEEGSEESVMDPGVASSRRLSTSLGRSGTSTVRPRPKSSIVAIKPSLKSAFDSEDSVTPPRPKYTKRSTSSRFSFRPAPLALVKDHDTSSSPVVRVPHSSATTTKSRLSLHSLHVFATQIHHPVTTLDTIPHSKLFFLLGFLFGPWCWLFGGWYLRSHDGERRETHGTRCRAETCGCGGIVQPNPMGALAKRHSVQEGSVELWQGVEKWVWFNRLAAVGFGGVSMTFFSVAVWAAATA